MFKSALILPAALAVVLWSGCGGGSRAETEVSPAADPEQYAAVRVENQNGVDMRIYVRPGAGGARYRLGNANALQTTMMRIPRTLISGPTDLVFEITPLGGSGRAFSERVTARPGEEILLRIGP